MSFYHENPETLTEEQRNALDETFRMAKVIDSLPDTTRKAVTVVASVASGAVVAPGASGAVEPGAAPQPALGLVAERTPSDEEKDHLYVAIAFDFTGSMQRHIDAAKDAVKNVVVQIQEGNPETVLHVAIVGYRDFNPYKAIPPQEHEKDQYEMLDFTSNMQIAYDVLDKAKAYGGDDDAENLAGALNKVGNLSWPKEISPRITKKIMIVTDTTPHGREYHEEGVTDNFPRGCPLGFEPKKQIEEFARQDTDVILVRLATYKLEKMIKVFDEAHQRGLTPGGTANFIVMDAVQQQQASMAYSGFHDDDDDDRCMRSLSETVYYGPDRSFGGDDDDEPCSFNKPSHFGIPRYDRSRCHDVSRCDDSDDDVDRSGGSDYFPAVTAAAVEATAAAVTPSLTIHDAFRQAFSKRK